MIMISPAVIHVAYGLHVFICIVPTSASTVAMTLIILCRQPQILHINMLPQSALRRIIPGRCRETPHKGGQMTDKNNTYSTKQDIGAADSIGTLFPQRSRDEYLRSLRKNTLLYRRYCQLTPPVQNRFVDFMTGKNTLPLTYDPFFKKLFNPDIHKDRLSSLISSIIGQKVTVKCGLSTEESLLPTGSMLIMDILVELTDGSIANVEIQKVPYAFPGERISCYSADLLLRQYSRVKGERGKEFTYKDLKKVYTIVLFEESPLSFRADSLMHKYRHFGKVTFDTGLEMDLLQEYFLIALDVFGENKYAEDSNTLHAWLSPAHCR